jgi:hypothetical protein
MCVFSNSKPGAKELLTTVSRRLEKEHGVQPIGFASKPNAAVAAETTMIDYLAEQYRLVILAVGD